jgi:alkanesulfonate monooxygenase SsuD/methylene tetrahydromethanopterin reductase-like flavin-dependent oxidoreductase (luciferase family)
MTKLLFGINVSTAAGPGADPVADVLAAEALGFDFASASDHPCGSHPTFETWTMLSWMAAATSRIRVASRVLGVPFRPPAMVAKMAASLDQLSGGRLILGLGGGASDAELDAFGLAVPSPRDKVDGLAEAIEVMRGLWSEPESTLDGRLYHTRRATLEPKPAQPIPIWLGTFGDRALTVTGRLADGWIPSFGMAPPDRVTVMRDRIFAAAEAAGRQPEDITCVYNIDVRVDEHAARVPGVVAGSPEAVAERLAGFAELGFTAVNFLPSGPDPAEQVHRLATEVMPLLA